MGSKSGSRDVSPRSKSPLWEGAFAFSPGALASQAKSVHSAETSATEDTCNEFLEEDDEESSVQKHRVCIMGDSDVGKTALVNQFLSSEYMNTYDSSLGKESSDQPNLSVLAEVGGFGEISVSAGIGVLVGRK